MDGGAEQDGGEDKGADNGEGAAPEAAAAAEACLLHLLHPVRAPAGSEGSKEKLALNLGDAGISYLSQSPSNKTHLAAQKWTGAPRFLTPAAALHTRADLHLASVLSSPWAV